MREVTEIAILIVLAYFILSAIFYTILLIGCIPTISNYFKRFRYTRSDTLLNSEVLPPVTVIMPAYNEEECIVDAIGSVLNSRYQNLYLIIVNDASKDNTMSIIKEHFELVEVPVVLDEKIPATAVKTAYVSKTHPNIMVLDKEKNGGRSDSLNVGVNACFTPYFMTLDGDTLMYPSTISEFVYDLMTHENTIVVAGGVYILNGCVYGNGRVTEPALPRQFTPAVQTLEYIRSHLFSRTGWNLFGGTMGYSGTATLYERKAVLDVGGFDTKNFAQDIEIIMHLHAYMHQHNRPYRMLFNPAAAVWTDVPATLKEFAKQRNKWRRGILRATSRYWYMFFNPRYGIQGLLGYPGYVYLEVLAPIIECAAYLTIAATCYLGIFNLHSTILFLLLAWGFVAYITIANEVINYITFNYYRHASDVPRLLILTFFETFGFRQYSVGVLIYSTINYIVNRLRGRPE
jgi:cellulose synthase/poly-beta-1,6-N-acetylglucosamine synthase-like glycosyltransferase